MIKIILKSLLITLVIMILLLFTRDFLLDKIYEIIKRIRGTTIYDGETMAVEHLFILTRIIFPIILILVFIILMFLRNRKKCRLKSKI